MMFDVAFFTDGTYEMYSYDRSKLYQGTYRVIDNVIFVEFSRIVNITDPSHEYNGAVETVNGGAMLVYNKNAVEMTECISGTYVDNNTDSYYNRIVDSFYSFESPWEQHNLNETDIANNSDGLQTFRALIVNALEDDIKTQYSGNNDAGMIYDLFCNSESGDLAISKQNVHAYSFHCDKSPKSCSQLNEMINYSFLGADDDVSVFYFTGHGDVNPVPDDNKIHALYIGERYYYSDLVPYLKENVRGTVVVILDVCYSEGFIQEGLNKIDQSAKKRFIVLTSCLSNEYSHERRFGLFTFNRLTYGCLTYYLGDAFGYFNINGSVNRSADTINKDGTISIGELSAYIKNSVTKTHNDMHPQAYFSDANYVLLRYKPNTKCEISLDHKKLTLGKGGKFTLNATITPDRFNTSLKWKSSNVKIATVNNKGTVTAKKKGACTITVSTTDGSASATCKLTVKKDPIKIKSASLNKKKLSLKKGKSYTLKADFKPFNATIKSTSYKTSDKKIATVSKKGVVKAKKKGSCTITVTIKDKSGKSKTAKCKVTVK